MAVKTKAVLKTYFETGDKPTQGQFEDLIDTMIDPTQLATGEGIPNITNSDIDSLQ